MYSYTATNPSSTATFLAAAVSFGSAAQQLATDFGENTNGIIGLAAATAAWNTAFNAYQEASVSENLNDQQAALYGLISASTGLVGNYVAIAGILGASGNRPLLQCRGNRRHGTCARHDPSHDNIGASMRGATLAAKCGLSGRHPPPSACPNPESIRLMVRSSITARIASSGPTRRVRRIAYHSSHNAQPIVNTWNT